jgi:hypothetical protein
MTDPDPDTEDDAVTVPDVVRWMHGNGFKRLAGVSSRLSLPVAAFAVEVADGTVTVFPAPAAGPGSEPLTMSPQELPDPTAPPGRLVVVGVTEDGAVLAVDLATVTVLAINGEKPEDAARSWVMQLLLNPMLALTTNSSVTAIGNSDRYRQRFTPNIDTNLITVDDGRNSITTIGLNPPGDEPNHLDITRDYTGELFIGARYWRLSHVLNIDDSDWAELTELLTSQAAAAEPDQPSPAGPPVLAAPPAASRPPVVHAEGNS